MAKNDSIETIERDFSRRTLQNTFETPNPEPLNGLLDNNTFETESEKKEEDPMRPNKKRRYGEDVPWKEEELLMLYKAEKWGKMHGNLSLAREIFLPRRSDSDIKDKKQTEEYKEFRQIQKEFENYGQSKKRKVDSVNEPKQKESSTTIEKKSGSDTPNKNEKQKPSLKEKKKIEIPNKEKKKAKK